MKYKNLSVEKLNHATFKIKNSKVIYFDPFKIAAAEEKKADLIFVSHEHFDHCSPADIEKITTPETVLFTISACRDAVKDLSLKEIKYVKPGDVFEIDGIKIEVVPAYNINKFRSPGIHFHPQSDGKAGFIVGIEGVRIYHAGDTDNIPEMKTIRNIDIALLPVSGTYVMTAEEAVEAVKVINPTLAIPMHYGDIVGTEDDAQKFKRFSTVAVEIL